jgi:hypothetical protein
MDSYIFYKSMQKAQFIISPVGDKPECYRHIEAIGLGTIPISDLHIQYKELYGDNMYFIKKGDDAHLQPLTDEENKILTNVNSHYRIMKNLIDDPSPLIDKYNKPNINFISLKYWKDYVDNIITNFKNNNL